MQLALAVIFIVLMAAGTGIGIYFIVKSLRAKKGAPPKQLRTPPPPTQPRTPPTQPLLRIPPPPAVPPPKPKPLEFAPYIPAKPKAQPPATKPPPRPQPPPPSKPPPQPQTPRTNCPKGKVPDPDNPSKLCKPSCRGVNLGYPYWGASGSCCASIANADCISWAQISKIKDDKLAAEAERKRQIAEAEAEKKRLAAIEAEKKRLAAIEAEKKRLAGIEAEKKRLAGIEAEKKRQQEAERKRLADEAEKKRLADEAKRRGCDDSLSIAFDTVALLKAVNDLRAGEGSKPLQWDADAARAAVAWASRGYRTGIPHGEAPGCRGYPQNSYRLAEPEYKASLGASRYAVISSKFVDIARGMWGEKQFLSPFPGANCGTPGINDKVAWTIGHYCTLANPGAKFLGAGAGPSLDQNSDNSVVTFVIHAF